MPKPKKRIKDPDKYARNLELGGFHDRHEDAELVVADGNKFTAGQITKRSNFVDGLVAHGHFAHLDLFGGGSGDLKNGALIFIHPDERQWISKELCLCDHDSTTAAGEKELCSLCAVRCKVIAIFGVPVTAMGVGDTLYAKYQVSRHVSYHVSYYVSYDTTRGTCRQLFNGASCRRDYRRSTPSKCPWLVGRTISNLKKRLGACVLHHVSTTTTTTTVTRSKRSLNQNQNLCLNEMPPGRESVQSQPAQVHKLVMARSREVTMKRRRQRQRSPSRPSSARSERAEATSLAPALLQKAWNRTRTSTLLKHLRTKMSSDLCLRAF